MTGRPASFSTTLPGTGEPVPPRPASDPTPTNPASGSTAASPARRLLASIGWDIGPAVLTYYGARALGLSEYVALLAGTLASAGRVIWVAARDRRVDGFAGFLLVLFGLGLALSFLTGDPRFVLAKDSVTTTVAGLAFLGSCLVGRPLCYLAARRMARPVDGAAPGHVAHRYAEQSGATDPARDRRWYVLSIGWGVGLLAEAALRLPLVYLVPLDVAVGTSKAMMVLCFAVLVTWTIRSAKRDSAPATAQARPVG
jgi:hypothetical protein